MKRLIATCGLFLRQPRLRGARKVVVAIVGGGVVLVGIAMLVLPCPAILVIPLGFAILATEFGWAKRWVQKVRTKLTKRKSQSARQVPISVATSMIPVGIPA